MKDDYYPGTYILGTVRWGRIILLLGISVGFPPAPVMTFRGYIPLAFVIIASTLMRISVSGALYIVEPISYFPILGVPGTYLAFLSGNTSSMRVPCSSTAQEAAGVEMGTEEGSIIFTIDTAASTLVNVVILIMGAAAGSVILNILPVPVKKAFNFLFPALFGAIFGQLTTTRPKLGVVAAIIAIGMNWLIKLGFLGSMPGNLSYVVILVTVFDSICAGRLLYRKELQID